MTPQRRSRIFPGDGDPRHGSPNGYGNLGCHCPGCTAAVAAYHREWRHADPERMERHNERFRLYWAAKRRNPSTGLNGKP